ncbi:MAG: hypothetical protein J6A29_06200 [Clostridia bacterium]|nr:hypothetical protein [Clostridia bacterium]
MLNAVTLETIYIYIHTQVILNNIFFKLRKIIRNKDPCCGLRLLYLRI